MTSSSGIAGRSESTGEMVTGAAPGADDGNETMSEMSQPAPGGPMG